jgi:hypothetical protein
MKKFIFVFLFSFALGANIFCAEAPKIPAIEHGQNAATSIDYSLAEGPLSKHVQSSDSFFTSRDVEYLLKTSDQDPDLKRFFDQNISCLKGGLINKNGDCLILDEAIKTNPHSIAHKVFQIVLQNIPPGTHVDFTTPHLIRYCAKDAKTDRHEYKEALASTLALACRPVFYWNDYCFMNTEKETPEEYKERIFYLAAEASFEWKRVNENRKEFIEKHINSGSYEKILGGYIAPLVEDMVQYHLNTRPKQQLESPFMLEEYKKPDNTNYSCSPLEPTPVEQTPFSLSSPNTAFASPIMPNISTFPNAQLLPSKEAEEVVPDAFPSIADVVSPEVNEQGDTHHHGDNQLFVPNQSPQQPSATASCNNSNNHQLGLHTHQFDSISRIDGQPQANPKEAPTCCTIL